MRSPTALAAVVAVLCLAGGALASWSAGGHGGGQVRVADPLALVLAPGTPGEQLFPGGSSNVSVLATNPNPYPVRVSSLTLDPTVGTGGFAVDQAHAACGLASLAFEAQDHGGAGWAVPPRAGGSDGALRIDLPAALSMGRGAAGACQGALFTVHVVSGT